ncbi:hypothetical protein AgCh_016853 [Apium graveolens]
MDVVTVGVEEVKCDNNDGDMKKQGVVKDLPVHNCAEDNPETKKASDLLSLCTLAKVPTRTRPSLMINSINGGVEAESDYLMDLQINEKYDWAVMVRVARKWTEPVHEANGAHLIVIDESSTRMEVWINYDVVHGMPEKLSVGKNYKIRHLIVQHFMVGSPRLIADGGKTRRRRSRRKTEAKGGGTTETGGTGGCPESGEQFHKKKKESGRGRRDGGIERREPRVINPEERRD